MTQRRFFQRRNVGGASGGGGGGVDNHDPIDTVQFQKQSEYLIASNVRMISGCHSLQTSADVSNIRQVAPNGLPNPAGKAGGACTSSLLEILYNHHHQNPKNPKMGSLTFQSLLLELRDALARRGFEQIPQLSSSRPLDIEHIPFDLKGTSGGGGGTCRALLVGINYTGQRPGELNGCQSDVYNMKQYLVTVAGYEEHNILVLTDDGRNYYPNRKVIINALKQLVIQSQSGDSVYFHYSGHGGLLDPDWNDWKKGLRSLLPDTIIDNNNNNSNSSTHTKNDNYDETIYPLDHQREGHIRDFSLFKHFVQPMPAGVTVTCIMDCCHSGSVLQLPYTFQPTNANIIGDRSIQMGHNLHSLTNLAFLYLLAGNVFPMTQDGLFDGITNTIESTTGTTIDNYIGTGMGDADIYDGYYDGFSSNDGDNTDIDYDANDVGNDAGNDTIDRSQYDENSNTIMDQNAMGMNNNYDTTPTINNDDGGIGDFDDSGAGGAMATGLDCGCIGDVLGALLQQTDLGGNEFFDNSAGGGGGFDDYNDYGADDG